jgi:hypothetical protein
MIESILILGVPRPCELPQVMDQRARLPFFDGGSFVFQRGTKVAIAAQQPPIEQAEV